jgi:transposase
VINVATNPIEAPASLAEALFLAATLAKENEELKLQLAQLMTSQYPEVLRPAQIAELMQIGVSTVNEWVREWEKDPENSPLLNRDRQKGEKVLVLKTDLYHWLKRRRRQP